MVTLRGLVRACHPLPTAAVTLFVTVVAVATNRSIVGCALVGLAVLTGQLSVGWCNDAMDAKRDAEALRLAKPIPAGLVSPRVVGVAAGVAAALCVPLSLASGVLAGLVHLVGVAAAWSYDLGAKRTALSWLPYVVGFGSLPAFVTLGMPGHPWPAGWGLAAAALLGLGAHLANVIPDIDGDLRTGVRGLPQRIGERYTRLVLPAPLLAASILLVFGPPGAPHRFGWTALAAALALTTLSALSRTRLAFRVAVAVAGIDVVLFTLQAAELAGTTTLGSP